jgi:enoyl-CoA hydratase/carnithine racemase
VFAVIVRATGKNFSTGNDLKAMVEFDIDDDKIRPVWARSAARQVHELADTVLRFPKPLISCVQGNVIGFWFTLMALFDIVLVTDNATFQAPMVKSAQNIEMCGSYTFPRLFGYGKAFELLVLAKTLTAKEAV